MAIKFPGADLFTSGDAKSRVLIIAVVVVVIGVAIYFGSGFLGSGPSTLGPSSVATAPSNLQSVPGGKTTAEYSRALLEANQQAAQQAQMSGGSSVPTLINVTGQSSGFSQGANCNVVCPNDDTANVSSDINEWMRQGSISPETGNTLLDLAKRNVSINEYEDALANLVKQGKLTPDQARRLLAQYKKQYINGVLSESANAMDAMIKSGQLPLDVANSLLAMQKMGVSPEDYSAELNRLVREGRLSPQAAAQLLAQYNQERAKEALKRSLFRLQQLSKEGTITPDVAATLSELQSKHVPISEYATKINSLVTAGKITPAAAAQLLEQYKQQHANIGNAAAINSLLSQAEMDAANGLKAMADSGEISPDVAATLRDLQNRKVSMAEYQKAIEDLVKAGKLSPEAARKLLAAYQKLSAVRNEADKLSKLQDNSASVSAYGNELKNAVEQGILTPEQAASLMDAYQRSLAATTEVGAETVIPGATEFNKLQQQLRDNAEVTPTATVNNQEFIAAASAAQRQASLDRQQRIEQMSQAMAGQAQTLIAAWQPPRMQHQAGSGSDTKPLSGIPMAPGRAGVSGKTAEGTESVTTGPAFIKTGTIAFAVLDTAVDSDYPDTPVMATIVQGPLKGSKLLGKLALAQGQDRLSLSFNIMNNDDWLKSKSINAFAIDPDTARTVMATSVDHHYLLRYGALMGASFLSGYSAAITNAGESTTGIFGTSTTHPALSPGNKIAVGLGQVGTSLTAIVQGYVNTPTTVKIKAGVGLGILFMSDVT